MHCYAAQLSFAKQHSAFCSDLFCYVTAVQLQANVWTEYISDEDTVEYMTFPRLAALAEAVWSSKANKDWEDFKTRLPAFMKHIEAMGNKSRALS